MYQGFPPPLRIVFFSVFKDSLAIQRFSATDSGCRTPTLFVRAVYPHLFQCFFQQGTCGKSLSSGLDLFLFFLRLYLFLLTRSAIAIDVVASCRNMGYLWHRFLVQSENKDEDPKNSMQCQGRDSTYQDRTGNEVPYRLYELVK